MADHKVTITYNNQTGKVTVPSATIDVNRTQSDIEFDLRCVPALPSGYSAKIVGVEFGKPDEPTGDYAPEHVFADKHTKLMNNANHVVYGAAKTGSPSDLILTDNNNVTAGVGDKEYGYKIWVEVDTGSGATTHVEGYHPSDDPKIKNTEPPPPTP
ncbi:MAG: hypothetical protein OEN01_00730 [Candidatus Krumholzibacteria bacterium]|nr:hypothetical protein [Candidatus Krumholzibacteria bacterium]